MLPGGAYLPLSGELNFDNCMQLQRQFESVLKSTDEITIDCHRVTRGDSAGVALLIYCIALANQHKKRLHIEDIPDSMLAIAKLGGVEQLLTNIMSIPRAAE